MKSDTVAINNKGKGFEAAVNETLKVAEYKGIEHKTVVRLQMITEEMLSMIRSITGEVEALFWIEEENNSFAQHVSTRTVMDSEKRAELLEASSSHKNEEAGTFLGKLRDIFEEAMTKAPKSEDYDLPLDVLQDLPLGGNYEETEWDGYERSILRKLADDIKISIKGGQVEMTVIKNIG